MYFDSVCGYDADNNRSIQYWSRCAEDNTAMYMFCALSYISTENGSVEIYIHLGKNLPQNTTEFLILQCFHFIQSGCRC